MFVNAWAAGLPFCRELLAWWRRALMVALMGVHRLGQPPALNHGTSKAGCRIPGTGRIVIRPCGLGSLGFDPLGGFLGVLAVAGLGRHPAGRGPDEFEPLVAG